MRKVEHYVCDICWTEYADKEKCRQCEENHREAQEIIHSRYQPINMDKSGYPEVIEVRMSDGKTVEYKRKRLA